MGCNELLWLPNPMVLAAFHDGVRPFRTLHQLLPRQVMHVDTREAPLFPIVAAEQGAEPVG